MSKTKIEWAEEVWNPVTGCRAISPGCKNCYAERMSKRLAGRFGYPAADPFSVTLHPDKITEPLSWKKPRRIFVCSMGDLFHDDVLDRWIAEVFKSIGMCMAAGDGRKDHIFMILTKRPERLRNFFRDWPLFENLPNVWLGVTAENQEQADARIPVLLSIPAVKRFVSIEPMLGPVDLNDMLHPHNLGSFSSLTGIHNWGKPHKEKEYGTLDLVICGGESGPGARPVHPDWVRGVRDQCKEVGIPFFFKQWGDWAEDKQHGLATTSVRACRFQDGTLVERVGKKAAGRMLDGKEYLEWPR